MAILWLVSWIGMIAQACFAVFSLASGLYYLAEIIEEYSILAKRVIGGLLTFVLVLYVLLLLEDIPLSLVVVGLLTHICFGSLLTTYPVISLCSPGFIGGTVFFVLGHYLAFDYFATEWHTFQEIVGFFFLCQWMVPFSIFISLSANDMVLPTINGADSDETRRAPPRRSGFLALIDLLSSKLGSVTPSRTSKSF